MPPASYAESKARFFMAFLRSRSASSRACTCALEHLSPSRAHSLPWDRQGQQQPPSVPGRSRGPPGPRTRHRCRRQAAHTVCADLPPAARQVGNEERQRERERERRTSSPAQSSSTRADGTNLALSANAAVAGARFTFLNNPSAIPLLTSPYPTLA
jgi:hypothetical protein